MANDINTEILGIISTPAVLMDKDDIPYEYSDKSMGKMTYKRKEQNISLQLYSLLMAEEISSDEFRKFSSGNIIEYGSISRTYC